MTLQEIFDTSTRGIIAQGGPAVDHYTSGRIRCVYRAPDGRKCAAGQLIPDEKYNPAFEGHSAMAPSITDCMDLGQDEEGTKAMLVRSLQSAHDGAAQLDNDFWSDWKRQLGQLPAIYGLSPAVLDEIPAA